MALSRRDFLKLAGASVGGFLLTSGRSLASNTTGLPENEVSMLYDATKCVGCRACQNACREWNHTSPEVDPAGLYDAPQDLSSDTWTLIQLYQEGPVWSFVKHQCMHCLDPACVSACPVAALQKTPEGPVVYDTSRCFGCRYCMMACPFGVPKYQWERNTPLIRKCTFCADRLAQGIGPACVEACPTGALTWGTRGEMLAEAKSRIREHPDRYVDHIYGEHEGGGTLALYLSRVPFEKLGFPNLEPRPLPDRTRGAMLAVPAIIVGMGSLMSGTYWLRTRHEKDGEEEQR